MFPRREIVPVEQLDNEVRPYFIHHRNQAGINNSLMDLFRLIDLFLREDESAREPLHALRLVSEYLQRRQIVAPMPAELVNFYDDPHTAAESAAAGHNPLAELSQLFASVAGQTAHPTSTAMKEQEPDPALGVSMGVQPGSEERESVFHVPLGLPSPSRPTRLDLALAFGDMPSPQLHQRQGLPVRAPSTMAATDHRSALIVDVMREKLRSWLRKPDTSALRKWVLKKRQKYQDDESWQFVEAPRRDQPEDRWPGDKFWIGGRGVQRTAETRSVSRISLEETPVAFPHGGIHVTQDTIMYRDSLPPRRPRSISASMDRPLPAVPPSQRDDRELSHISANPSVNNQPTTSQVFTGRRRRNSSAAPYLHSNSSSMLASPSAQSTPTAPPQKASRTSIRERNVSDLFSKKSDSSWTDVSLQAHLHAQLYRAKFVAGIPSIPMPQPSSAPPRAASFSRKLESSHPQSQRMLPPQIPIEVGRSPDVPSIMIQPPSRSQTLSMPRAMSPPIATPSSWSSEQAYQSLSHSPMATHAETFDRNPRYQTLNRGTWVSSTVKTQTRQPSPLQHHGSHQTNSDQHRKSARMNQGISHQTSAVHQRDARILSPDSEEDICRSTPLSVHHGLPTPKSVEDRGNLPLTTPVASIHDNTNTLYMPRPLGHNHSLSGHSQGGHAKCIDDACISGSDGGVFPLVSRFSLDSHFTVSTGSTAGRSASPASEFHSFSEAASHEGEFLAQLASRRKKSIRSGISRTSRRTSDLHMEHNTVSEEVGINHSPSKAPVNLKERNRPGTFVAGQHSQAQRTTHRRVLTR